MNINFRNINTLIFSFLVVINLETSFGFITSKEFNENICKIERLISCNKSENNSISFVKLKQSLSLFQFELNFTKESNFDNQIKNQNLLEQIYFISQKNTVLSFKPALLKMRINEISIQKSHCV